MTEISVQNKIKQAHQYFNNQEFAKAAILYQELIQENPQLRSALSIRLAHCLILAANWPLISANLIPEINYLSTSGWLNSLFQGKPVNAESKPIPWYTYPAIEFLEDKIKPDSIVFEFGGGNSTLWWANKAKQVISIESDRGWYDQIKQQMPDNVQLNLEVDETKYADFINQYPDQYFDVIIVDGINRNSCLENSLNKLKKNGLLIFDNTDRYEYDQSINLLLSLGFKKIDFYGLIPSYTYKNCTSIFFKSTEILENQTLPSDKKSCLGKSCMQITNPKPINTETTMENLKSKVIYDLGANNGSNIEYYLMVSDVVVAVEANPLLAKSISEKFSKEINEKKLFVKNAVLTVDQGFKDCNFYLHKTHDVLSTIIKPSDKEIDNYEIITLPSVNILELIDLYGEPYYIKIDLEGFDHILLEYLLLNGICPPYISAECHTPHVFCLLVALGKYQSFKLVEGASVQNLYKSVLINSGNDAFRYDFPHHSAGPFGNDIIGEWMTVDNFFKVLSHVGLGWKDIHASKIDSANINYLPELSFNIVKNVNFNFFNKKSIHHAINQEYTPQKKGQKKETLSVCMMVQNCEKTLDIALSSLENVYDELIIVDGGSTDKTIEIAKKYGAKIIHSPWSGNHSQQRNVYLKEVKTDWVFVLDSDEFIDIKTLEFLKYLKVNGSQLDCDNFWVTRKWICHHNKNFHISSLPHYPDWQRRIFRYNQSISYSGQIHETINGLEGQGKALLDLSVYHLDLFINDIEKQQNKIRRYSNSNPRDGGRHFYLPNPRTVEIIEWKYEEILPSVQNLLDTLNNLILYNEQLSTSPLSQLIQAEIKNDEFYQTIQNICQEKGINNILEIGSSSGGGSTEAFVKGIKQSLNQTNLFCMEVSPIRFNELKEKYHQDDFVKCYNMSSVALENFPSHTEIINFYEQNQSNLNFYPLEQVLSWLQEDIAFLKKSRVPQNGIKKIKAQNQIDYFDIVLIDGSEFTGLSELEEIYGAKYILLDDINTFKNYHNHRRLLVDPNYELIKENLTLRNGYSIFKRCEQFSFNVRLQSDNSVNLPIHFFTIVLNGEPFIRHHINVLKKLPFRWHWHIVEGVAQLNHDTAWSLHNGGRIAEDIHRNGLSKDGTTEYINLLKEQYPENITIYRKPEGIFWDGKREMINEPLYNIEEDCLLWQIDVDELWTVEQICKGRQMFIDHPEKTAAFYWCWYFVGENLVISTRNCYAQNPQQDWLRTWRYKYGCVWVAHEPPILAQPLHNGQWQSVAQINPFLHHETEQEGLIFQHFAYATKEQLQFKETYYGYKNAVSSWLKLQAQTNFPVLLKEYFSWVSDQTMVDTIQSFGTLPIAQKKDGNNNWIFANSDKPSKSTLQSPIILIDGVFFQLYKTGIARVWKSLLEQWANTEFANHILVLDRVNTAPKINGIRYRTIHPYDYNNTEGDRQLLQQICDEEGAELFISSYYTTPIDTPSVFMAYDMIPEVMGGDLNSPMWREKHKGINHAASFIAISENTALDINKYFPEIPLSSITVAHCGVNPLFSPASPQEIANFKYKYGIQKPYFLLGALGGYKNSILFMQAFAQLANKTGFDLVATGAGALLPPEWRQFTAGCTFYGLQLTDEELRIAYSGAVALVYPSKYEGFGMPVIEAMACGCPVITTPNASLPEAGGNAVIYVKDDDVEGMADALCEVQKPSLRRRLIAAGLQQAQKFSWSKMAEIVKNALFNAILPPVKLGDLNYIIFPNWEIEEDDLMLGLNNIIKGLVNPPQLPLEMGEKTTENPPYQGGIKGGSKVTLVIDTTGINEEDAELLVSGVAMNLMMEEEIDISETLEISFVNSLTENQWSQLLPKIHARIVTEFDNLTAINAVNADSLLTLTLTGNNYLMFPNWNIDEETLGLELMTKIQDLAMENQGNLTCLLIDYTGFNLEDANLLLSSVIMNLMLENELDISESINISFIANYSDEQWQKLTPFIKEKITLINENLPENLSI